MGGTATYVAEEMAAVLAEKGGKGFVVPMEKAAIEMFAKRKHYIICSSSHGTGDIPDNGLPFFEKLKAERPDLSDVSFGTVALGDMTYSASFCGGGKQFDHLFEELGAKKLVDRLEHDRQSGSFPEDDAIDWLEAWLMAAELHPKV